MGRAAAPVSRRTTQRRKTTNGRGQMEFAGLITKLTPKSIVKRQKKKSDFFKPPPRPISAWKPHPVGSTRLALGRWGVRKSLCVRGKRLSTKKWRLFHFRAPNRGVLV